MVRHRLLGPIRFTLVATLLGALLVTTASVVSAAASIAPTPGSALSIYPNTWSIPYATTAFDLDVDCGTPTTQCSVWVARNNAAKATEALFTNVTGARSLIPVDFINDGCFNFRLYDSAHALLVGQINVGHAYVCSHDGTGTGQASVLVDNLIGQVGGYYSGIFATLAAGGLPDGVVDWDSGFAGGVEDSQVWVSGSRNVPFGAYTDCKSIGHPNGNEVLFARNVSGEKSGLAVTGGGPYCFTVYQGTAHTTPIAGPVYLTFHPYVQYIGGTANGGLDPTQGRIYFASGNGDTNALVCVWGPSIAGSDILHQTPFAYNSEGWNPGGTVATFQTAGKGVLEYQLHVAVGGFDAGGNPTAASCQTGIVPANAPKFGVDT